MNNGSYTNLIAFVIIPKSMTEPSTWTVQICRCPSIDRCNEKLHVTIKSLSNQIKAIALIIFIVLISCWKVVLRLGLLWLLRNFSTILHQTRKAILEYLIGLGIRTTTNHAYWMFLSYGSFDFFKTYGKDDLCLILLYNIFSFSISI